MNRKKVSIRLGDSGKYLYFDTFEEAQNYKFSRGNNPNWEILI